MKGLSIIVLTFVCVLYLFGCMKDDKKNLELPFESSDIKNIEMFNYEGVPQNARKKIVTKKKDIQHIHDVFQGLECEKKNLIKMLMLRF
ncbi:hypothetical protein [Peptoniphilus asaccharolyticus]|uniref:hypothetical protein n=1 Tax=Peptoniphilus asaccharolyticus TaxID=1258 RepID=UPI000A057AE1|nr:hypothetical protein [Peptoniphilus asaccharolyticus]MBL7575797.1 hypothetical protein [Peptoniphilus asaccharolyticus]